MSVFRRLLMLSGGGTSVPYDYPDKFAFFADQAIVDPSVLEVLRPDDRLADFTVDRDSSATYVDSDGIIKEAFAVGDELVTNGDFEDGETGWTLGVGATITNGKGIFSSVTTNVGFSQITSMEVGKSYEITYTIDSISLGSIAVKAGGAVLGIMRTTAGTYTETLTATDDVFYIVSRNAATNATIDNISVKEVSYDIARIDYTNGVAELLTEPQSTNLIIYSEDFNHSRWTKAGATIDSNTSTSPNGTLTADSVLFQSGGNISAVTNTLSNPGEGSASVYVKAAPTDSATAIRITSNNSVAWNTGLSTKAILTNEWQRIDIGGAVTDNTALKVIIGAKDEANVSDPDCVGNVLVWGAQAESLPYATSYIPTNGSSVTRLQDVITDGGNVNVINSEEGTLFFEGSALFDDATWRYITASDGSDLNRVIVAYNDTSDIYSSVRVAQANVFDASPDQVQVDNVKIAIKWKLNDFATWVNGVEVGSIGAGVVFPISTLNTVNISDATGTGVFFGRTRELKVYDRALTDEELEQITTL